MTTNRGDAAPGLLFGLTIGAFACPVFAFQPLVTDDTGTQGEAGNQLEFSIDRERAKQSGVSTRTRTIPLTFTRGLTDALDAFGSVSHVRIDSGSPGSDASGNGNPGLGIKWRFFESDKSSIALKPEVLLPVSEARERAGLGNGRASWSVTLIVTHELGFGAVHANLGASRSRFRDPATPASNSTAASIAPVWNVTPNWKLALDLGFDRERAGNVTTRSRLAEIGVVYSLNEDLEFALGFIGGRNSETPRVSTNSATVGVTWRFR